MSIAQAKRFTLDEYHRLGELGFFHEDDHIELINGEIIEMASKGTAHETCLRNLWKQLPKIVGDRATLQSQAPITLPPKSEPEPDFAIVQNRDDNSLSSHPQPADVLLVMEVSDSSLAYDQDVKIPLYAQAGIADYWIFNLFDNQLQYYSVSFQDNQGKYGYLNKRIILSNQVINFPWFPDLSLDLAKVFPPKLNF
ncbi:Uma2 family endonuclease [Nostoc sp. UCD121]|uniref:Uma2 family endonuclease n=1 Tax=unclassified Nostoc TaxID=2593658 RepID=UPI00162485CB|nr:MULTISPECIES: Uma2 family endonuclease [unclassified Nostoc]MBC1223997.1 Uma2 family endonuclease [Nostoc sp. UCD120]MBC1274663.1 Uma2 family endonuclease [Nostoc sp. UCD121]MBC1293740.1 Uma2 family endonuclease [Nostoc sp. UCD122]